MYLNDLMDPAELQRHINEGYVKSQPHPSLPLRIYNYTPKTQYEQRWNEVTEWCRGLIVDDKDKVIGLPFKKFHNYDGNLDLYAPATVSDKMDGSLGIICSYNGELVVATRGSFISEMAQWAYSHIVSNYFDEMMGLCQPDVTMLVEIIYPENRIVVNYGNFADIVLLGIHDRGVWVPASSVEWSGSKAETFPASNLHEALQMPARPGLEGLVVYFVNTGDRVKIKYDEYVEIHRAVFNLTRKAVWRNIMAGTLRKLMDTVPDEFHEYIMRTAQELRQQVIYHMHNAMATYTYAMTRRPNSRKDFFSLIGAMQNKSDAMLIYDGQLKRLNDKMWDRVEPKGDEK